MHRHTSLAGFPEPQDGPPLENVDPEHPVLRNVCLAPEDGALAFQQGLDPLQVYAVQPLADVGSVVPGQDGLHFVLCDEGTLSVERDFHPLDRAQPALGCIQQAHGYENHDQQGSQTGYDQVWEDFSHKRFSSMSVMGPIKRSILPAPKVTSTSTGSWAR